MGKVEVSFQNPKVSSLFYKGLTRTLDVMNLSESQALGMDAAHGGVIQ